MSGDDREPIGRKGKPAGRKPARARPVRRSRRDDDYEEYEEEIDDEYEDDDDYEEERESRMSRKAPPRKANKGGKKSARRRLFWLLVKLFVVFLILLGIYAVYLNKQIHDRIDGGKVWQLPAAVYGRQVNLEPDMQISKAEMVGLLEGTQYREVTRITRPGEFTVHANYIDLLRRPFDFP